MKADGAVARVVACHLLASTLKVLKHKSTKFPNRVVWGAGLWHSRSHKYRHLDN